ncbi:MAG: site-specific integrase [Ruminococcaceae bacterium]|nr:site-specific integrase [Oscillospiraceae bacterium]
MCEWLETVQKHKIQETTYNGYKRLIDGKMKRFFGNTVTLDECDHKLINNFYNWLRNEGACERTILRYHNLLHVAFKYAVKEDILETSPLEKVDRPQQKKFVGSFYSPEELQTLLALTEEDTLYIPIVMAAYYGLRRSEILGLSWNNVNFDTNEIHICQKAVEHSKNGKHIVIISEDMKTESSRRTLPLIPDVREILLTHKAKQERQRKEFRNGYKKENLNMICLNPIGEIIKPNYVTTHFPEILNKYGLRKIRFHDLRHTCASMLLSKNIHMKVIQTWLGHSNMSTTADIYSHLESKSKLEAGNVISTLLAVE